MQLLPSLVAGLTVVCATFPDARKGRGGNIEISDFGVSAFSMFFMQSASFLAFQRALEKGQGRSNGQTLFGIGRIPSDNYIRDRLDEADPALLQPCFERMETLLAEPPILILDEPTVGLDPNQIVEIRDVIKNYGKNRTVLFSSHILQEVEAICDRVIIIHQGKIIADNNLSDLRQEQTGKFIKVVLKESVTAEAWQGLDQLRRIRKTSDFEWELEAEDPELLKKQLLSLSLQNNWNIVSLQSENRSLEDIFRGLTKTIIHE